MQQTQRSDLLHKKPEGRRFTSRQVIVRELRPHRPGRECLGSERRGVETKGCTSRGSQPALNSLPEGSTTPSALRLVSGTRLAMENAGRCILNRTHCCPRIGFSYVEKGKNGYPAAAALVTCKIRVPSSELFEGLNKRVFMKVIAQYLTCRKYSINVG